MQLNKILWVMLLGSGCAALLLWLIMRYISTRYPNRQARDLASKHALPLHRVILRHSYNLFSRIPLLRARLLSTRHSLLSLYGYHEWLLRERTALITWGTITVWGAVMILFFIFEQDWISTIMLLLLLSVAESLYMDFVIQRAELNLLKLSFHWFSHIRFAYQRHRMVEQAVEDALEHAPDMVRPHANRLLASISATNRELAIVAFEESAPNRHYRLLARLLQVVAEYGDPGENKQSSLLKGISMIIHEMQSEYVMRFKLGVLLKGLRAIAVIPILFVNPIEYWARNYFPLMNHFYDSELGLLTRLIVFITVLCCNHLLNELQWRNADTVVTRHTTKWIRQKLMFYEASLTKKLVFVWIRILSPQQVAVQRKLLRDMNSPISIERWYSKRLGNATMMLVCSFACSILIPTMSMYDLNRNTTLWLGAEGRNSPSAVAWEVPASSGSNLTEAELKQQKQMMKQYQDWVYLMPVNKRNTAQQQQYFADQISLVFPEWSEWKRTTVVNHLIKTAAHVEHTGWNWKWLSIPLLGGMFGYMLPLWVAIMKKRLIALDIQIEISQFHMLVLLLRNFERMTVEMVIDWMAKSSTISRPALQRCLIVWDRGAEQAIAKLKSELPHPEFVRFLEQLELAHEQLPLRKAFDDAEQSWNHDQEMKREWEENMIETRSVWGQWIGFAPMYAIIFLYLVLPLLWLSAGQMGQSFRQIQTLS